MNYLNIAGYKFISLNDLPEMRSVFLEQCLVLQFKGTILLSEEGINISLSGAVEQIALFKTYLAKDLRFADMTFRESYSDIQPFKFMRVKLKKEIITMKQPSIHAELKRAPSISPIDFKQWLDEKRDITILDTRNDYEIKYGTFANAIDLKIKDFSEFPHQQEKINPDKPIVMFCTGGVRCEKAALQLMDAGYSEVYQLEGGILNYFSEVGGAHYNGECFVFDHRVALDAHLQPTRNQQCIICESPITPDQQAVGCASCH
ncbi:MAG: rhodanese-like domain-containing protein [Gammaproteobacteria bacterium]|nr:rhodanese-like domain-containing protein [Gammaproteobacteria bacterium]